MDDFSLLSDNELLQLAHSGNMAAEEQLAFRYARLVKICARPFFLVGGDAEDLNQEGMMGLLSAIREYDLSMNATFRTYAEICVKRRIYSAIKTASRKKHEPLNDMVSFEDVLSDEIQSSVAYPGFFRRSPEELLLDRESANDIIQNYSRYLSKFEAEVLKLYLEGYRCSEIADGLDRSEKSVDNAVQRIRRKLARNHHHSDFSES